MPLGSKREGFRKRGLSVTPEVRHFTVFRWVVETVDLFTGRKCQRDRGSTTQRWNKNTRVPCYNRCSRQGKERAGERANLSPTAKARIDPQSTLLAF